MKIAVIDPSLFTWPYDHALIQGLRENGHDVSLFTKYLSGNEPGKNADEVVELFYPGLHATWAQELPHPVFLAAKGIMHPLGLIDLMQRLRRLRPDVIHFQWAPLPAVDRMFLPQIRRIAPTVLTVHDSAPFNDNPRSVLQRVGAIGIMNAFDRLIVHTNRARQRLAGHGLNADKIAVIAHGVLESGPSQAALPAQREHGEPVTVLLFGKLKPYKGADVLIRALAAMPPATRARCRVHIVGKPYMDVEPLFALARELQVDANIVWDLRFVADDEMEGIFSRADIIAMPYREIDASGVLMVALSAGVPIVASRIGLFAEMLEDGQHGRLVASGDSAGLGRALGDLVENAAERHRISDNVRHLRASIPDWRSIAAQTAQLYRSALADRAGGVAGERPQQAAE